MAWVAAAKTTNPVFDETLMRAEKRQRRSMRRRMDYSKFYSKMRQLRRVHDEYVRLFDELQRGVAQMTYYDGRGDFRDVDVKHGHARNHPSLPRWCAVCCVR